MRPFALKHAKGLEENLLNHKPNLTAHEQHRATASSHPNTKPLDRAQKSTKYSDCNNEGTHARTEHVIENITPSTQKNPNIYTNL